MKGWLYLDKNSCTSSQIDGLIVQFKDLKSKASKLHINLYGINEKLLTGNYVQQDLLMNTTKTMEEYNELQNEFYHNLKEHFSDFPIGNFDDIEKFLYDSNQTYIYNKSIESLRTFLSVNIDNKDVNSQLQEYKDNVYCILLKKGILEVIELAKPYELFIDIMNREADEITIEQEDAIEEVFPKPMPRMLFSKQFYIDPKLNTDQIIEVLTEDAEKIENNEKNENAEKTKHTDKTENKKVEGFKEEKAPIKEKIKKEEKIVTEEVKKEKKLTVEKLSKTEVKRDKHKKQEKQEKEETTGAKERTSGYSYNARKQAEQFKVSTFKADMQNINKTSLLKLLNNICLFRLLTENQIKKYVFNGDDTMKMDNIINKLYRDGYLTEIINKITAEKSYSLSKHGVQVFERKGSRSEFINSKKLINPPLEIPDSFVSDYNLSENEDAIKKYITLNDVAFSIHEKLDTIEFIISHKFFNKETEKGLPYSLLTPKNEISRELNLLVLDSNVCIELGVEELSSIIENNSINIIFCIIKDTVDFDEQKTQILYNKKFYYVNTTRDKEQLIFTGIDSSDYNLNSILQTLNIENIESESEKEISLQVEETEVMADEGNSTKESQDSNDVTNETEETSKDAVIDLRLQNQYTGDLSSVIKLLSEERLVEAVVLAKALSFIPNKVEFNIFYKRLLYATNMSIDNHEYSSDVIIALDNKDAEFNNNLPKDLHRMLRLSTFLWALLVPDVPHDFVLYKYKDSVIAEAEKIFESTSPSIKTVFEILFELCDYSSTGFSNSVVSALKYEKQNMQANDNLKDQAKSMLSYKTPRYKAIGVPELYKTCFDNTSNIGKCMHIISESDIQSIEFVKGVFDLFDEELSDTTKISNKKIEEYIDNLWDNVTVKKTTRKKLSKLPGEIDSIVFNNIRNRLEIISQWLIINDNNNVIKNNNELKNLKNRLISSITSAYEEIEEAKQSQDEYSKAGLFVLHSTLNKAKDYLHEHKDYHDKWDYIELLKSHYISLDNEYKPILNKNLQSLVGFEPWRRVIGHINSKKTEYGEALKLIDLPDNDEWFKNYNSATFIGEYLFETIGRETVDNPDAINQAQLDSEKEKKDFIGELELAYAYGRLEESRKEDIIIAINEFSDELVEIGDFATFRSFLNALRDLIKSSSEYRKKELTYRTDQLKSNIGNIDISVGEAIRKNLKEQNFTVVEEYLNRIEQGDSSLIDELRNESVSDAESDYHERFIHSYNSFLNLCKRNVQENVLVKWAEKGIESKIRNFSKGQKNNSKKLLESWPKGRDSKNLNSDVKRLFANFGFIVNNIEADSNYKKCELFNVNISKISKNLEDYSYPIARFGTQISEPVSVLCLFGRTYSSPNSLKEIFIHEPLELSVCTFVLVDAAFSLIERRQIAELLKAEIHSMNSFIIIDRVLMLYLATLDSSKWLSALLKCTLPYTYCQPYVQGAGVIADEMFFGRKAELHNIRDYGGASLVYGGRQLGKTALLLRACSLMNNPVHKKFAVYIDVTKLKAEQVFTKIYGVLKKNKIIEEQCTNIEEMCSAISNKLSTGEILGLQIFIDEVDVYFEDISDDDYEELKPFKKLRDSFPNRFKVVFAGLHKVAHNKNNSVILHLGASLCIKPLSPTDAKNLIERPLSYLGFRFQGDEGKKQLTLIMANTNYYPGLLHLFCYKIVESISENYKNYYGAAKQNPPYTINEEYLGKLLLTAGLNDQIKRFFRGTLELDPRYKLIANIIAYLSYRDKEENTIHLEGFHMAEIKNFEDIQLTKDMKDYEFETLLNEMVEMGILWNKSDTKFYRLRRNSFLEMLGSYDDVFSYIYSATEGVYE